MNDYRIEYIYNGTLNTITRLLGSPEECQLYCEDFGLQFISCQQVSE